MVTSSQLLRTSLRLGASTSMAFLRVKAPSGMNGGLSWKTKIRRRLKLEQNDSLRSQGNVYVCMHRALLSYCINKLFFLLLTVVET